MYVCVCKCVSVCLPALELYAPVYDIDGRSNRATRMAKSLHLYERASDYSLESQLGNNRLERDGGCEVLNTSNGLWSTVTHSGFMPYKNFVHFAVT